MSATARASITSARSLFQGLPPVDAPASSSRPFLAVSPKGPGRATTAAPGDGEVALSAVQQSHDPRLELKSVLLSDVQSACKKLSREQLADEFSKWAKRDYSLTALEKLWNPAKDVKHLSAGHIPAWCQAMDSKAVLEWAAAQVGLSVATEADRADAALGRRLRQAGGLVAEILREVAA